MSRFSQIRSVGVTGSTNEDMAQLLGQPQSRGLTLVADFQRRGSGRKGRAWIAPPGCALLFTTALPEPVPADALWLVPFWSALAVHAALAHFGVAALLQWPNDVLIDGRKAAGILCISRVTGALAWAAAGIGINVRRPAGEDELSQIDPPPAFVGDVRLVERDDLLAQILSAMDRSCGDLSEPSRVVGSWNLAAGLPGARYRIALDGEDAPFEATAIALVDGGSLEVEHGGVTRSIALADARILRD